MGAQRCIGSNLQTLSRRTLPAGPFATSCRREDLEVGKFTHQSIPDRAQLIESEVQRVRPISDHFDTLQQMPTACIVLTSAVAIASANGLAADMLNIIPQFLMNKPLSTFFTRESRRQLVKIVHAVLRTGVPQQGKMLLSPRHSKSPQVVEVGLARLIAYSDAANEVEGRYVLCTIQKYDSYVSQSEIEELSQQLESKSQAFDQLEIEFKKTQIAKDELIAHLAHELRTPLQSLLGISELFRHIDSVSKQRELSLIADVVVRQMMAITESSLSLARMEVCDSPSSAYDVELVPFLNSLLEQFQQSIIATDVKLVSAMLDGVPNIIKSDPVKLRQILTNLISNAIKFTRQGSITIKVEPFPLQRREHLSGTDKLLFSVSDTGPGMEESARALLFKPFVCAQTPSSRATGGTGLGLHISKRLIESLGGDIAVESSERGCTVLFTLPAEPVETDALSEVVERATIKQMQVLLAEDSDVAAKVITLQLEKIGCMVVRVCNGQEAVEAVELHSFDLVFMDCQMPVLDGFEATASIRSTEIAAGRKHLPIVALTAGLESAQRARCRHVGMDDLLSKPASQEEFLLMLDRFVP